VISLPLADRRHGGHGPAHECGRLLARQHAQPPRRGQVGGNGPEGRARAQRRARPPGEAARRDEPPATINRLPGRHPILPHEPGDRKRQQMQHALLAVLQ